MTRCTLFLDIDGVLCPSSYYFTQRETFWKKNEWARTLNVPYPFDPLCVKILNEITDRTKCEIVITSDWKTRWDIDQLREIFEMNRVACIPADTTCNDIVSVDSEIGMQRNRTYQIGQYVERNGIYQFAIVDDLELTQFIPLRFRDRFVKVIEREGIKQTSAKEKIIRSLELTDDVQGNNEANTI